MAPTRPRYPDPSFVIAKCSVEKLKRCSIERRYGILDSEIRCERACNSDAAVMRRGIFTNDRVRECPDAIKPLSCGLLVVSNELAGRSETRGKRRHVGSVPVDRKRIGKHDNPGRVIWKPANDPPVPFYCRYAVIAL